MTVRSARQLAELLADELRQREDRVREQARLAAGPVDVPLVVDRGSDAVPEAAGPVVELPVSESDVVTAPDGRKLRWVSAAGWQVAAFRDVKPGPPVVERMPDPQGEGRPVLLPGERPTPEARFEQRKELERVEADAIAARRAALAAMGYQWMQ